MPSKKAVIKTYLTADEQAQMFASASKAGLSLSTFVKRVCLGHSVESVVDAEAVLAMLKVNADLGRLGGLFKAYLAEADRNTFAVRKLLHDIEAVKDELTLKIRAL